MPASRVQFKANTEQADPASAVFDAAPTPGNLLVVVASERSGNSHALFTITGTGWTKAIGVDVALADTSFRRSMAVWWKIAGAGEPTGVTVDNGTTSVKRILMQEFTTGDSRIFGEVIAASANNGSTATATSQSTGTTTETTGAQLVVGALYVKRGNSTATYTSTWTNGLGSPVDAVLGLSNTQDWCSAYTETNATGTKESTATISNAVDNVGLTAGILAVAMSTPDVTPPTFTSWVLNADGVTLVGTADEPLHPEHVPTLDRLIVKVNGVEWPVASVVVSGATATLTLSSPASGGDVLTISGAP